MQHSVELKKNSLSSLFNAIHKGHLSIVDTLLSEDVNLKTRIEVDGEEMTALQFAVDRYDPKKHNARDRLSLIFSLLSKIKQLAYSETDYAEFGVNDAFINAVNFILIPVVDHFLALGFPVDCVLPRIIALISNCSPPPPGTERKLAETFSSTIQLCIKLIPYFKPQILQKITAAIQPVEQKIKEERPRTPQHKRQITLIINSITRLNEAIKTSTLPSSSTNNVENETAGEKEQEKKQKNKKKNNKNKKKKASNEKKIANTESKKEKITDEAKSEDEAEEELEEISEEIPTEPLGFLTSPTRSRRATMTMMDESALFNLRAQLKTETESISSISSFSTLSSSTSSQWSSPDTTPMSTPASTRAHTPIHQEEENDSLVGVPLLDHVQCPPGLYFLMGVQVVNLLAMREVPHTLTFFCSLAGINEKLWQLSQMDFPCLQWHAFIVVNEKQEASLFFEKPLLPFTIQGAASVVYDMRREELSAIYFSESDAVCYYPISTPRATYVNVGFQWGSQQSLLTYPVCAADYFTNENFFSFLLTTIYSVEQNEKTDELSKQISKLVTQHRLDSALTEKIHLMLGDYFPEEKATEFASSLTKIIQFPEYFITQGQNRLTKQITP